MTKFLFLFSLFLSSTAAAITHGVLVTDEKYDGVVQISVGYKDLAVTDDLFWQGSSCSATAIDEKTFLTAEHCLPLAHLASSKFQFRVAVTDRYEQKKYYFIEHIRFANSLGDMFRLKNGVLVEDVEDFATLTLSEPHGLPIYPVYEQEIPENSRLKVLGYGCDMSQPIREFGLKFGFFDISDLTPANFFFFDRHVMTCAGDSGGPAFIEIDEKNYLVGVVSGSDDDRAGRISKVRLDKLKDY